MGLGSWGFDRLGISGVYIYASSSTPSVVQTWRITESGLSGDGL